VTGYDPPPSTSLLAALARFSWSHGDSFNWKQTTLATTNQNARYKHTCMFCVLKYESEKKHVKLRLAMSMFSRQINEELYISLILSIIFIVILILKRDGVVVVIVW